MARGGGPGEDGTTARAGLLMALKIVNSGSIQSKAIPSVFDVVLQRHQCPSATPSPLAK